MSYKEYLKEAVEGKTDIKAQLIDFFAKNPNPPDSDVHKMAEDMGIAPDKLETTIYSILSDFFAAGNYIKNGGDIDPDQLAKGIKVEMEHTTSDLIAEKIAKDHLSEIPNYYDLLEKMEASVGVKESVTESKYDKSTLEFENGKTKKFIKVKVDANGKVAKCDISKYKNKEISDVIEELKKDGYKMIKYIKELFDVSDKKAYKTDIKEVKDGDVVESYGRGFGHVTYIGDQGVTVEFNNKTATLDKEEEYGYTQFAEMIKTGSLRVHRN